MGQQLYLDAERIEHSGILKLNSIYMSARRVSMPTIDAMISAGEVDHSEEMNGYVNTYFKTENFD